jgi:fibro-slime domain-containing protein
MWFTGQPALGAARVIVVMTCLTIGQSAWANTITLTATIRDLCGFEFAAGTCPAGYVPNPDFERAIGDDRGLVLSALGADGTPTLATNASTATISDPSQFGQWYHDVKGANQTTNISLALNETAPGSGLYSYSNLSFFPIDGQLLGNQGRSHNYSFTFALHTDFTYRPKQTFDFYGDDDIWVFINKKLVIDLGGVHQAQSASVELDKLGLTAGNTYDFDLFFAERHTIQSTLALTTSIVLNPSPVPEPSVLSSFMIGAGFLGAAGWRRRKGSGQERNAGSQ